MISRHDFTKPERDLLNLAVTLDVVDAVELAVMVASIGVNVNVLVSDLTEAAFTNIHSEPRIHNEWVKAVDCFNAKQWGES